MMVAKDKAEWNRTRALAEVVWAAWMGGEPLPDGVCAPYGIEKRPLSKAAASDNFADLMGAMGRLYGGR